MDITGFFQRWGWFLLLGAAAFFGAWFLFGRHNKMTPSGSTNLLAGQSSQPGINGQPVVEYVPTTGDQYTNINYQTDSGNVTNSSSTVNNPLVPPRPPRPVPVPIPGPVGPPGPPGPAGAPGITQLPLPPTAVQPPAPVVRPPLPPVTPPPPAATHPTQPYTIKWGDTLSSIAARYHTTWQILYNANKATIDQWAASHHSPIPGGPWNNIFPSEQIHVPA